MIRYILSCAAILIGFTLSACVTDGTTTSLKPVCKALGPPHEYNDHKLTSPIHAGPELARRLHRDNQVGEGLPCPGY